MIRRTDLLSLAQQLDDRSKRVANVSETAAQAYEQCSIDVSDVAKNIDESDQWMMMSTIDSLIDEYKNFSESDSEFDFQEAHAYEVCARELRRVYDA